MTLLAALKVPTSQPAAYWVYFPALLLAGLIWWEQGRRQATLRAASAIA